MADLVAEAKPSACLVDLSDTTHYKICSASIHAMAKSAPAIPGISIPVIVVAPAAHMFGATRMFQISSEENRPWLRVVESSEEAYEILQVKSPSFEMVPLDPEERKKVWNSSKGVH